MAPTEPPPQILPSKPKYIVQDATEADLPAIVDIQFKSYGWFAHETLAVGPDTPENQAKVLQGHVDFLKKEPASRVAKVIIAPDHNNHNTDQAGGNYDNNEKPRIVGFCIFVLPNFNAEIPEERIPISVRPKKTPLQATWLDDPVRRAKVETHINAVYPVVQRVVAGRNCAWVRYMTVLPEFQRQGIGQLVMQWGCDIFDKAGLDAALLASPGAERLYGRFGFENCASVDFVDFPQGDKPPGEPVVTSVMYRVTRGK